MTIKKDVKTIFKRIRSSLVAGQNYSQWYEKHYDLQKVKIKNTLLAKELEDAAQKTGNVITFAEYLAIDQFGKYGYHARHKLHGFQNDLHIRWAKKLVSLCLKKNIKQIVDIGCGDGNLGVTLLQEAKKKHVSLTWTGVEINEDLHPSILSAFRNAHLEKQLAQITTSIKDCHAQKNVLLIFSFSLDSIPPEVFINTSTEQTYPDKLIGLRIKNDHLQEQYLTETQLKQRGTQFKNGIYATPEMRFDLRSWRLQPQQRLYLATNAFSLLFESVTHFPNSSLVIIDEFCLQYPAHNMHITGPKNIHTLDRNYSESSTIYTEAGENLYYYPTFLHTMLSFLRSLGFSLITYNHDYGLEKIRADSISGKENFCLTIFASQQTEIKRDIAIISPHG